VFLGTSEFAAAVLRRLASSAHRPSLIITRADRPKGRGRRRSPPPIATAARELEIELDQPESVNDESARARIALANPDVVCVCSFGALIKEPLLSDFTMLNVHPSLLPRWRGAAPIERAIMAGDGATGVSIMRVTAGLDSGPVCAQEREPIDPQDNYGILAGRLERRGGELLVRTLDSRLECVEQEDSLATYAEKITSADRQLDPTKPATELERRVRALTPHLGAHVQLGDGSWLGVREARALATGGPTTGAVSFDRELPTLGCANGALELIVVQPPGRRPMTGQDFIRGYHR
jgi:methionyl-tRNA formyltransferase